MPNLLEMSAQYREAGTACRGRMREKRKRLQSGGCGFYEELELKRSITMLTAMSRDCMETSKYLKDYCERREKREQAGK